VSLVAALTTRLSIRWLGVRVPSASLQKSKAQHAFKLLGFCRSWVVLGAYTQFTLNSALATRSQHLRYPQVVD
jgi:hypothetical protein